MLKKSMILSAAVAAALVTPFGIALAQDASSINLPVDTKLVVKMDVEAMQESGFGKRLIELVMDRVMEEIADRAGIAVPDISDVEGFIGFNPLKETRSLLITATDFEKPEEGLLAVIAMKKTVGSVEAMLPSIPGYSVKTVGEYKIHSGSPDGNMKINLAIHTDADGSKTLVVSSNEDAVSTQLARMDGKAPADEKTFQYTPCAGAMVDLHVLEIPADRLGEGPQTIIAAMVKEIGFHLIDDSKKLNVSFDLKAVDDENAEQLDQMLQGIVPMLEGQVSGFVDGLQVKREGMTITLAASMGSEEAVHLLSSQFDTAIGMVEGLLGNR